MNAIEISTARERIDLGYVHSVLRESYWARGIPCAVVQKSIEHSLCFGVYRDNRQIGFGRVVSDQATFAYIADVFIDASERGQGLGRRLIEAMMQHPDLQGLRRWHLVTRDAQSLYAEFGFQAIAQPMQHMEIRHHDIYRVGDEPGTTP